jgi:hypothetical protein
MKLVLIYVGDNKSLEFSIIFIELLGEIRLWDQTHLGLPLKEFIYLS